MTLEELLEKAETLNIEIYSDDLYNVYLVKNIVFDTTPLKFRSGISTFSSRNSFPDNLFDDMKCFDRLITPFDPDATATLYGDLEFEGPLRVVKDYFYGHADFPTKRLWIEHLNQTARLDTFMSNRWYVPLLPINQNILGLPVYLNKKKVSLLECCQDIFVDTALTKRRIYKENIK